MGVIIRPMQETDLDEIVHLSLLAWEPVFTSFAEILGPKIYALLYPDWQKSQAIGVTDYCTSKEKARVLVAEAGGRVIGFLAYELHPEDESGEVILLAVTPDQQNDGVGTELNLRALQEMKAAGMRLAVVGTGGDDSHAPARRSYEKAGYTPLPLVRYYRDL